MLLTSLLTFAIAATCFAGSAEDELVALDKSWAKAVEKNDFAAIEAIVDPELVYSHSDGQVDSKEVYMTRLRKGTSVYQAIEFDTINAKLIGGNIGLVNARAMFRVLVDGKQVNNELAYTHVYVKRGGKWKMISHQSALLKAH